jgi:ABC-type lipoprotein export system ATPase subunit
MLEEDDNCLMILDEPTSNLDFETEKLVCDLVNDVCKTTLVIITHREAIKDICDYEIKVQNHHFELK